VAVPDLAEVRTLAEQLHHDGNEYQGIAWASQCSTSLKSVMILQLWEDGIDKDPIAFLDQQDELNLQVD
jgi:hypothetical protein